MASNLITADCRSIPRLLDELDRYRGRIPLTDLTSCLERTQLCLEDVRERVCFHPDHYQRNLMHDGAGYQALVICWRNGQRSPIHDHSGSSCAVKVVHGTAMETLFEFAPNGMVYAVRSSLLPEGSVTASQDRDVHQVSNVQQDDADLVTFHIYSPPLLWMNMYSLLDASVLRFLDPVIDEFVSGAGI